MVEEFRGLILILYDCSNDYISDYLISYMSLGDLLSILNTMINNNKYRILSTYENGIQRIDSTIYKMANVINISIRKKRNHYIDKIFIGIIISNKFSEIGLCQKIKNFLI